TLHSGGLGSPSAPTTRGCLQWLDAVGMKAGESLPDRGARRALVPAPKSRARGQKSPAHDEERWSNYQFSCGVRIPARLVCAARAGREPRCRTVMISPLRSAATI